MGATEQMPDGWIRKESRSRPNHFYYFNTKTGKTQWEPPANKSQKIRARDLVTTKPTKIDAKSKGQSFLKINDKSKDVKKSKSKTPAQDRLQNLIESNMAVTKSVKKMVADSTHSTSHINKRKKSTVADIILKIPHTVTESNNGDDELQCVGSALSGQPIENKDFIESAYQQNVSKQNVIANQMDDEIPALFPSKTPAQNRLKMLQGKLSSGMDDKNHDALEVFHSSFGIGETKETTFSNNVNDDNLGSDDIMDWQPCNNDSPSFEELEDMAVDIFTDSAYIVPDTNVFVDSLETIKSIIDKDLKHTILIPFVVLQELDQLKHQTSKELVSSNSSRAIKYIYKQLKSKNQRLKGQKATEDSAHIINVTSPDDKILNCCLQLKGQSKEVILVTNDINLSNKALLSGIEALTSQQCSEIF